MKKRLKILTLSSIISFFIICLTFFLPIPFSGINGISSTFWLFISDTGGVIGVPIITFCFCLFISFYFNNWKHKMLTLSISLILFTIVLGGFAKVNESYTKEYFKIKRPYVLLLDEKFNFNADKFYSFTNKNDRSNFLITFFENSQYVTVDEININSEIIEHWISETGYSFPSGHAINSFIMAFILGYIFLYIYYDYKRKYLFLLPYIWAILVVFSRVAVGAHSSFDIFTGAIIGTTIGFLTISTKIVDNYLKKK